MAGDDPKVPDLKIMSDEELEASLHPDAPPTESQGEEPYYGPENRSGKDRRQGPADRREMVRFESAKGQADRRSGDDRRRANKKPKDLWDKRDF